MSSQVASGVLTRQPRSESPIVILDAKVVRQHYRRPTCYCKKNKAASLTLSVSAMLHSLVLTLWSVVTYAPSSNQTSETSYGPLLPPIQNGFNAPCFGINTIGAKTWSINGKNISTPGLGNPNLPSGSKFNISFYWQVGRSPTLHVIWSLSSRVLCQPTQVDVHQQCENCITQAIVLMPGSNVKAQCLHNGPSQAAANTTVNFVAPSTPGLYTPSTSGLTGRNHVTRRSTRPRQRLGQRVSRSPRLW